MHSSQPGDGGDDTARDDVVLEPRESELGASIRTVENYRADLMVGLDPKSRVDLVNYAGEQHLL